MAINRSLWNKEFTLDKTPLWTCPYCNQGQLIGNKTNIKIIESENSKKLREDSSWEQIWISGSFGGVLQCINPHCKESIQIIGKMSTLDHCDTNEYGEQISNIYFTETLLPVAFFPTLNIFPIHEDVPEEIKNAIIETFKLYWIDMSSCANKIRTVVELILDKQGVDRTNSIKKYIPLNNKIEKFEANKPEEAEFMKAIKWIGNEASHKLNTVTKDDVLDALEMLENLTTKLYEKDSESQTRKLKEKRNVINEIEKPLSHKIEKEIKANSDDIGNPVELLDEI